MGVITLTTDFGTADWFVGTMKGVILGIAARASVIDITHDIEPGDIRSGAFAVMAGCRFFPRKTVHVAVVDPGVGSDRAAIAVETADYFFVGPDNGVLSWALARERIKNLRRLENGKYFRHPVSHTFHGRDIFAPVAAHLSTGVPMRQLGPAQADFVSLEWRQPVQKPRGIQGEVIWIDRFGNAITNIHEAELSQPGFQACTVWLGNRRLGRVQSFYQAVARGRPVAVIGSSGFLEVAVNRARADRSLGLKVGTRIRLEFDPVR